MQERIPEYVATLKVKSIPDYETPARECAEYFDGRRIDMPNASDWETFKEYYREKYRREKGKDISETTLEKNYVARGKAFYRWCNGQQDGNEQTASLFEENKTEAITPPAPDEDTPRPTEAPAEARPNEGEKRGENVRVNFLLSKEHHEALMSLALLEHTTLTEILTEAVKAHIDANSERVKIMREAIKTARSK